MHLFEKRELLWKVSLIVLVSLVGLSLYTYSNDLSTFSSELNLPLLSSHDSNRCSAVEDINLMPPYLNLSSNIVIKDFSIDNSGNIYILEDENHVGRNNRPILIVKKIDSNGNLLSEFGYSGINNGQLSWPSGIDIDSNNFIYIADSGNSRVQKFSSNNDFITQWGSEGSRNGQFNQIFDITIDSANNVYVADSLNYRIQKFDSNGRFLMKFGSQGSANGQFASGPRRIAIDSVGNIYVTDFSDRVQKFDSNGRLLLKWNVDNGPRNIYADDKVYVAVEGHIKVFNTEGRFLYNIPNVLTGDEGSGTIDKYNNQIYIAENSEDIHGQYISKIKKLSCNSQSTTDINTIPTTCFFVKSWGSIGSGNGQFILPSGIDVDSNHNIYVSDMNNDNIQVFDSEGNFLRKWGSRGTSNNKLTSPRGLSIDSSNNVYVVDAGNFRVQKFNSNGGFLRSYPINRNARFGWDVVLGSSNNFFVSQGSEINEFDINTGSRSTPTFIGFPPRLNNSLGLAFDSSNRRLFVGLDRIYNFYEDANNQDIVFGSQGANEGQLDYPIGLDIDYNNNYLYEADIVNKRVQIFTLDGRYVNKFGDTGPRNGKLFNPRDVAYDAEGVNPDTNLSNHFVYVADLSKVFKYKCASINLENPSINVNIQPPSNVPDINFSELEEPVVDVPETSVSCSDSDGLSPSISGRVTSTSSGSSQSYIDSCISSSNFLWEYSCLPGGLWKQNCYKCDSCLNSKCVNAYKRHTVQECESSERRGA
ncbi:MAG: 6-bladed beta-propeller [Nanoarchaeota archaeon]